MGDGDIMAIDGVGVQGLGGFGAGFEVDDELVAVKIEVYPLVGAAAFFAAEDIAMSVLRHRGHIREQKGAIRAKGTGLCECHFIVILWDLKKMNMKR